MSSSSSSPTSADVNANRISHLADTTKTELLSLQTKNMKALLDSGKYADVILKAGGKEFKAHKNILTTNSPVFAAMFEEDDTAEAVKSRVDIEDVSADVMQQMLAFIYTGEVQKMEMYASELLSAACKFQLDILKSYCNRYSLLTCRSTFPVTHLPDLALLCVFKQLPPADQFTARQVCTRWATLVPESARAVRSLTIAVGAKSLAYFEEVINDRTIPYSFLKHLINEDSTPMYPTRRLTEWNSLQYLNLDEDTVRQITSTFKIKQLQFATDTSYQHLITILGHWRHQLTTLRLYHLAYCDISADLTTRLFAAINSMSVLKSLVLELRSSQDYRDLSVLSQLVDITISLPESSALSFLDSLQRHAQHNTALLRIDADVHSGDIQLFNDLSDQLCARFVSLSSLFLPSTALEPICTRFPSLTTLSILSPSSLRHLFTSLSRLTELIYLHLDINFTKIEADRLEHLLLPQVNSIKVLDLWVIMSSHLDLSQLHLPRTMPNLQVIFIDFNCTTCGIDTLRISANVKANPDKAKECFRQILRPLKRDCLKLRHILHSYEVILGTAEELLAE